MKFYRHESSRTVVSGSALKVLMSSLLLISDKVSDKPFNTFIDQCFWVVPYLVPVVVTDPVTGLRKVGEVSFRCHCLGQERSRSARRSLTAIGEIQVCMKNYDKGNKSLANGDSRSRDVSHQKSEIRSQKSEVAISGRLKLATN